MKNCFYLLFIFFSTLGFSQDGQNFYTKFKRSQGLLIKGSKLVEDQSLEKASKVIDRMIFKRVDIKERLMGNMAEISIIAKHESYCDLPEARDLRGKKTFDGRDFCKICGGGGVMGRPITAVCEDNLLKTASDPYFGKEDILTHEFAHTIHLLGMNDSDKKVVTAMFMSAKKKGTFEKNLYGKPAYMMANEEEFFACLSAVWFGVHNPKSVSLSAELNGRESIKLKLPGMYYFLKSIYPE